MSQLMADFPGQLRRLVLDPVNAGPWPYAGGAGGSRSGRPDSRANPWGLPIGDSSLGTGAPREGALAATMEDVVLGALQEGAPAATPAPAAAPAPQEAPRTAPPASAAAPTQPAQAAAAPQAQLAAEPSAPHPSHEPSQLPTPQPTSLGLAASDIMQALEAALAAAQGNEQPPQQPAAPPADAEMAEAAPSADPMQQQGGAETVLKQCWKQCACWWYANAACVAGGDEDKDEEGEHAPAQPQPDAAGGSQAAIDNSFLEALPTGLRDEVMAAPAPAEAPAEAPAGGSGVPADGASRRLLMKRRPAPHHRG